MKVRFVGHGHKSNFKSLVEKNFTLFTISKVKLGNHIFHRLADMEEKLTCIGNCKQLAPATKWSLCLHLRAFTVVTLVSMTSCIDGKNISCVNGYLTAV